MNAGKGLRERIIDTAVGILHREGARKLTQPQVARALGIRQSHLTYYFPHRADLLMAMASRFLEMASESLGSLSAAQDAGEAKSVLRAVHRLVTKPEHMRSFLGLIVEADQDAELRAMLGRHIRDLNGLVAKYLDRPPDDSTIGLLLSAFRGVGLESLLLDRAPRTEEADAIGRQLGLIPANAGSQALPSRSHSKEVQKKRRKP